MTYHDEVQFSNKMQISFLYYAIVYIYYYVMLYETDEEIKCSTEIISWKFLIIIKHT